MHERLKRILRSVEEHVNDLEQADPEWPFPHRDEFFENIARELEEAAAEVRRIRDEGK